MITRPPTPFARADVICVRESEALSCDERCDAMQTLADDYTSAPRASTCVAWRESWSGEREGDKNGEALRFN